MRWPSFRVQLLICACLGGWLALAGSSATSGSAGSASGSPANEVSGAITVDTTWDKANSPYVVTGDVTVNPDVTLQIEPGVEVRFDGNYALIARGALLAEGTSGQPIAFTSNQASPAPGDWAVIDIRADGQYTLLRHVIVEYGGNSTRGGWGCAAGAICANMAPFELDQSVVRHNATRGLVLVHSDATVSNNTFEEHPEEAISLYGCDTRIGPCRPTIAGNRFTGNGSPIARRSAQDPYLLGNQSSGNGTNGFVLSVCRFEGENVWHADLPYVIPGWCTIGGYGPAAISVEPGAVVKIDGGGLTIKTSAVLTATGTAEQPIVFTSFLDDSVGGDTNGDGDATAPAANDYGHVSVTDAGTRALFEHVVFRYGGSGRWGSGPNLWGDWDSTIVMHSCDLSLAETGITVWRGASLVLEDSLLHDLTYAGVHVDGEG